MGRFDEVYRRSLEEPEEFWAEAAAAIDWDEPWQRVLDDSRRALLPLVHRRPAQHLPQRARPPRRAAAAPTSSRSIYDSPVTDTVATFTYRELRDEVARFAGALAAQGVERGDRVIVYMPMVPEAVIAMLACARLGAVHSVVFGGFAANELASRIEDAEPKVVVSGVVRHRARPHRRLQAAARRGDRPRRAQARALHRPPAADARGRARARPRRRLAATPCRAPSPSTASPSRRPTRSTSSTRPGRPGSRRASCATTAATPSRSSGR